MKEPVNSVLLTPGYAAAIERDRLVRDASFLELTENVAGFELKPMTLRHYLVLRLARCPLLYEETPSPVELAQFLWTLSTEREGPGRKSKGRIAGIMARWRQRRFFARCRRFVPPRRPVLRTERAMKRWERRRDRVFNYAQTVIDQAREFVAETMLDRPGKGKGGYTPSYYSDVCFWWGVLGRHGYLMTRDEVLDAPLKILFQCIREVTEAEGGSLSNASSAKAVAEELARRNAALQTKAETVR